MRIIDDKVTSLNKSPFFVQQMPENDRDKQLELVKTNFQRNPHFYVSFLIL